MALTPPDQYHLHEELQYIELVNSEEGNYQEIVVTNLDRYFMPVIRVKTGDFAEELFETCSCGINLRKIRLLGRTSHFKKIGGEKLDTHIFTQLLEHINLPQEDFSVHIEKNFDQKDQIILCLSLPHLTNTQTKTAITNFIFRHFEKLKKQIDHQIVAPLKFREIQPEDIKFTLTGKHILVQDKR